MSRSESANVDDTSSLGTEVTFQGKHFVVSTVDHEAKTYGLITRAMFERDEFTPLLILPIDDVTVRT